MKQFNIKQKDKDRTFWDINPCGGTWTDYSSLLDFMITSEPYIYDDILARFNWDDCKVLEVGCGQGPIVNYLPSFGVQHIVGVDQSSQSLKQAKRGALELRHTAKVSFLQADADNLPFPNDVFDRVLSIGVLHHTPDTQAGINNIYRVLKPGGMAVVMLYRSGNPKWWLTRFLRWMTRCCSSIIVTELRKISPPNETSGTALLELFGVPILRSFSNFEAKKMFRSYSSVQIINHDPGFRRLGGVFLFFSPFKGLLSWIDEKFKERWGFFSFIIAFK